MDRRQRKTRAAIFAAFGALLAKKSYGRITVQEIIEAADVGRTTFYAHFETKEELLRELCAELFGHIVESAKDGAHTHGLYSEGGAPASVFCHLFQHLRENDRNIAALLSCESNEIFLRYFKDCLNELVRAEFIKSGRALRAAVPPDFLVNHISCSFVETAHWWIKRRMAEPPEEMDRYFRAVVEPLL